MTDNEKFDILSNALYGLITTFASENKLVIHEIHIKGNVIEFENWSVDEQIKIKKRVYVKQ